MFLAQVKREPALLAGTQGCCIGGGGEGRLQVVPGVH